MIRFHQIIDVLIHLILITNKEYNKISEQKFEIKCKIELRQLSSFFTVEET